VRGLLRSPARLDALIEENYARAVALFERVYLPAAATSSPFASTYRIHSLGRLWQACRSMMTMVSSGDYSTMTFRCDSRRRAVVVSAAFLFTSLGNALSLLVLSF
jgi:hypothetical protein